MNKININIHYLLIWTIEHARKEVGGGCPTSKLTDNGHI